MYFNLVFKYHQSIEKTLFFDGLKDISSDFDLKKQLQPNAWWRRHRATDREHVPGTCPEYGTLAERISSRASVYVFGTTGFESNYSLFFAS